MLIPFQSMFMPCNAQLHPMASHVLDTLLTRCLLAGYKSLRKLRNLEILDLSFNGLESSIFPFLSAVTSLTTLKLRSNLITGPFPVKGMFD